MAPQDTGVDAADAGSGPAPERPVPQRPPFGALVLVIVAVVAAAVAGVWYFGFREDKVDRGKRLIAEARKAMQDQDYTTAEKHLRTLLRDTPDSAILYHNLGILYMQQGRKDDARAAFERSVSLSPPTANEVRAEELFELAQISFSEKDYRRAAQELEQAIAAHPTRLQLHTRLLDLQLGRLSDPAAAESTTARMLRLCGRTPTNLYNAAYIHAGNRSEPAAQALARQAVTLSDSMLGAHSLLARSLGRSAGNDAGLEYLEGPLQRYPRSTELWVARAGLLQASQRNVEALAAADHALAIDPKDYPAHQVRALALTSLGRNEEALAEVQICRKLTQNANDQMRLRGMQRKLMRTLGLDSLPQGAELPGQTAPGAGARSTSPPATSSPPPPETPP